jgi:hypothetical protein
MPSIPGARIARRRQLELAGYLRLFDNAPNHMA